MNVKGDASEMGGQTKGQERRMAPSGSFKLDLDISSAILRLQHHGADLQAAEVTGLIRLLREVRLQLNLERLF
jgi:hypothetical protein